jgi:hypothetical protein
MPAEQRRHQRFQTRCELRGKTLTPLEHADDPSLAAGADLRGILTDIGGGGVCLTPDHTLGLSAKAIEISEPFVCWITPPHMTVGIPTLLQVRWVHEDRHGQPERVGLQFLLK